MAFWSSFGLSGGAAAGAAASVAVAVGGFYGYKQLNPAAPDVPVAEITAPETSSETAPVVEETVAKVEPKAPEPVTEEIVVVEEEPAAPIIPIFDLVRVDPEGAAAIAGTAAPNSELQVFVDGVSMTTVTTDRKGKFVALFDVETLDKPQIVELKQTMGDDIIVSDASVIIAPFKQPEPIVVAEVKAEPVPEVVEEAAVVEETVVEEVVAEALEPEVVVADDVVAELVEEIIPEIKETVVENVVEKTVVEPVTEPEGVEEKIIEPVIAPAVLMADADGVKVLQQAGGQGPSVLSNVVIDAISYNESGDVQLAGRGHADRSVRFYLDNESVRTAKIEADGTWRTPLPQIDAGIYTLRVDELDDAGKVTSRFETPFLREEVSKVLDAIVPKDDAEPVVQEVASNEERSVVVTAPVEEIVAPALPETSPEPKDEPAEVVAAVVAETIAEPLAPIEPEAPKPVEPVVEAETPVATAEPTVPKTPTQAGIITVQPGYTLWAIARDKLGEGNLYVQVYEANKSQIKDPNMIFPGQIFELPNK
ncbi:Peptidoglycan-binding LysM [Rhodobacterales bacterium HTCC2150]|nr:Peptidoglycan-binding LysM [Rhodobacterales bacterium HTCC2150] [Rhodobacteraceae bacterium HTCC2150]